MAIRSEVTLDTTKARGEARRASNEIANSMSAAARGGGSGGGKGIADGAESALTKISSAGNVIGMIFRGVEVAVEKTKDSLDLGKELDDLKGGLKQVLPASADLEAEMSRIESMMDQPGVDWKTATKLHTSLIALGKTAQESEDLITGIGNALKSTGDDSPEALASAVEMLTKIDDKGAPAIKQIAALAQTTTGLRVALEAAFKLAGKSDKKDFIITYVVEEGPRYKFGPITVDSAIRDEQRAARESYGEGYERGLDDAKERW